MSYPIEIRPASKNGWHTPAEARAYYKRYSRGIIAVHWWNSRDLVRDSDHNNIVNYILGKAKAGTGSIHLVVSNKKITKLVDYPNVAWHAQAGNPVSVGIEFSPHLNAEGYKKAGWVVRQIEKRFNRTMQLYPHKKWYSTVCPGTLSLDRIRQEANKWKNGAYNPKPIPPPTTKPRLSWKKFPEPVFYKTNKKNVKLWDFNKTNWDQFGNGVKTYDTKGLHVAIYGQCINHALNTTYLLTEYSYTKKITHGFNEVDLDVSVTSKPKPDPVPVEPEPTPNPPPPPELDPEDPEWVTNLRDIDDTTFWIKEEASLIDITDGAPIIPVKTLEKDEEFVASALTVSDGVEYRITEYSFSRGIFHGIPIGKLTLTPPGEDDIDPVPENPDLIDKNIVITFLESIVEAIQNFINKWK